MDDELFLGYCYFPNGMHTEAIHLRGTGAAVAYIRLQLPIQYKVVICDGENCCIFESLLGKIVYPQKVNEPYKTNLKSGRASAF